jgi:hypothetical protein
MENKLVMILVLVFHCSLAFPQKYRAEVVLEQIAGCNATVKNLGVSFAGQNSSFVSVTGNSVNVYSKTMNALPVDNALIISGQVTCSDLTKDFLCTGGGFFNNVHAVNLSNDVACSNQYFSVEFQCDDGAITVDIALYFYVVWTPLYDLTTLTTNNYCASTSVNLVATSGISGYSWLYRTGGTGSYGEFYNPQGSGSSIALTAQNIFGPTYIDHLGSTAGTEISVQVGACVSKVTASIFFYPDAPTVTSSVISSPVCPSGSDGEINLLLGNTLNNVEYYYSVSQFVPLGGSPCAQEYLGYCYGAKANFKSTSPDYLLTTANKIDNSDIHFDFRKGLYKVKIESSMSKGVVACF